MRPLNERGEKIGINGKHGEWPYDKPGIYKRTKVKMTEKQLEDWGNARLAFVMGQTVEYLFIQDMGEDEKSQTPRSRNKREQQVKRRTISTALGQYEIFEPY